VAVIDTGFALNHEALRNQWWTNPGEIGPTSSEGPAPNCTSQGLALDKSCNNLDNDGDGYASDWRGWDFVDGDNNPVAGKTTPSSTAAFHGSFVAGLVGGASDNANGDSGVAWGARIMPLQVLADTGTGYTDAIANAIDYAVAHGASVINLSLGSSYNDPFLHQSIDAAIAAGVTVVAASGNSNCDCILYPANYPETIAVGATDTSDARASFSSYGANLDLVAPGANVCSAFWTVANSTTSYGCGQGTSFATPLVAGAAALILSRHGTAKPADIARYLAEGADSVAAMATDTTHQYGAGRLDITQALLQATQPTTPKDSIPASIASGPDISTLCQSPAGTSCSLKLTGPTGTVITVAAKTTDRWGSAEFYWQPAQLGLTPGLWKVETMSTMLGDVSPSYVQVSG
jgi:subtilisin family serine protease